MFRRNANVRSTKPRCGSSPAETASPSSLLVTGPRVRPHSHHTKPSITTTNPADIAAISFPPDALPVWLADGLADAAVPDALPDALAAAVPAVMELRTPASYVCPSVGSATAPLTSQTPLV
ncbi:hypothetical protein LTR16_002960, partial [Cryomyces antarcticus]